MPYIKDTSGQRYELLLTRLAKNPGELNFLITETILNYWEDNGKDYRTINDILGALEGAKLEFYRRIVSPYEDQKIQENGDVYRTV